MRKDLTPDWVQFNLASYLKNTRHLTTLQKGAYTELLWAYYSRGRLPTDDRALATISGLSLHQWAVNRPALAEFFDENWKHERVERELALYRAKSEVRAEAGKLGGWAKATNLTAKAAPPEPKAPPGFFDKASPKPTEAFEANPLIENNPPLANATILPHRLKSKELEEESSSSRDAAKGPPDGGDDDDELSFAREVKKALGPLTLPHVAVGVLPTVVALIADGCDREADVLPGLRDIGKVGLRVPSPAFLGNQIRARRDARLASQAARATTAPAVAPTVFVKIDTPQWEAWRTYRGRSLPTNLKGGWHFATEWPPGHESAAPPPFVHPTTTPRFAPFDLSAIINHAEVGRLH